MIAVDRMSNLLNLQISPDDARAWWVAHTRPRQEKALVSDLVTLGIQSYLPLYERVSRSQRSGRTSRSWVPVFSSYVFVLAMPEDRYRVLRTQRVAQLLVVSDQTRLIHELLQVQRVLANPIAFRIHRGLKAGSWARVVSGPLAGTEGVVEKRLSCIRLALNVEMLGQCISVEVLEDMLEPLERQDPRDGLSKRSVRFCPRRPTSYSRE